PADFRIPARELHEGAARRRLQSRSRPSRGRPHMTLLLAIKPSGGNWAPEAWRRRFSALDTAPIVMAGAPYDAASVKYAACWKAEPGLLATLPNLQVNFNLGA